MAKKESKKASPKLVENSIFAIEQERDGGLIALLGFSYQCLYSCYLVLVSLDTNTSIRFEGIEDIDSCEVLSKKNLHIQIKQSKNRAEASFLKDVLKNFLEVSLVDNTRYFKMVYDFEIADGHLSKLIDNNLDKSSTAYWQNIINDIKKEKTAWQWEGFNFDNFISHLSFAYKSRNTLIAESENLLIKNYDITTGNYKLFFNSLKVLCFEKMVEGNTLTKLELDCNIQDVKDDISKGSQNPAYKWIKRISYEPILEKIGRCEYYEGKKATPADIAMKLPVKREDTENEIELSIENNCITIIKASSGQGKTTLAFQVAYNLKEIYSIYQLTLCDDSKELSNIIEYFKSRIKLGEKPLIIIDNLDSQLSKWNLLAQDMERELKIHYKLLLTTRETDWYNYSGDLSDIRGVNIINISMDEIDAQNIYDLLKNENKIHDSINDWRGCWTKVADRKLLIEYIYLLTHGEMIAERVSYQIKSINKTGSGRVTCEILRKVCLADICGVSLSAKKLLGSITEKTDVDYGALLENIEKEFLIKVDSDEKYIEGLHPVRSQHIVTELHHYIERNDTALQLVEIVDDVYADKLFANFPEIILTDKENFYSEVVQKTWNSKNHWHYLMGLQGIFSGSIMQYYNQNKDIFDDADIHGGLLLLSTVLNPFNHSGSFLSTLDELKKITPENKNMAYLCDLKDKVSTTSVFQTDVYIFAKVLYEKFKQESVIFDIESFSSIVYWLLILDKKLNLAEKLNLKEIWNEVNNYSFEIISNIMYSSFYGDNKRYLKFITQNKQEIFQYLKVATKSVKLYLDEKNKSIHVEYILLNADKKIANDESVNRIKYICKTLPIYETYCADAITAEFNVFSGVNFPNDSHKRIPLKSVPSMFHQEFVALWEQTIMSNYECESLYEWLNGWIQTRKKITLFLEDNIKAVHKLLENKPLTNDLADRINKLKIEIIDSLIQERRYPHQERPFEEKPKLPEGLNEIESGYFANIRNYCTQIVGFLRRDSKESRLAMHDLNSAKSHLTNMQAYFTRITIETNLFVEEHNELCITETRALEKIIIANEYYLSHEPTKYFKKFMIDTWFDKHSKEKIDTVTQALSELASNYKVFLPQKYYMDGILKCIPMIIKNLDITDSEQLISVLHYCIPIIEYDFSYCIIIISNDKNVIRHALKIDISFLEKFKTSVETGNESILEGIPPFLPTLTTPLMVACFNENFILPPIQETGYEGFDNLFELLWAYSQYPKYLVSDVDSLYLKDLQEEKQIQINKMMEKYYSKLPTDYYSDMCALCEKVSSGKVIDNKAYSELMNDLICRIQNVQANLFDLS